MTGHVTFTSAGLPMDDPDMQWAANPCMLDNWSSEVQSSREVQVNFKKTTYSHNGDNAHEAMFRYEVNNTEIPQSTQNTCMQPYYHVDMNLPIYQLPPSSQVESLEVSPAQTPALTLGSCSPLTNDLYQAYNEAEDVQNDATDAPYQPYAQLLHICLKTAPNHERSLQDIYSWMRLNSAKTSNKGWMNSVRHNLSMNGAFINTQEPNARSGKRNNKWRLAPYAIESDSVMSTTRYRKEPKNKVQKRSQEPAPLRVAAGAKGGQASRMSAAGRRQAPCTVPLARSMEQISLPAGDNDCGHHASMMMPAPNAFPPQSGDWQNFFPNVGSDLQQPQQQQERVHLHVSDVANECFASSSGLATLEIWDQEAEIGPSLESLLRNEKCPDPFAISTDIVCKEVTDQDRDFAVLFGMHQDQMP